MRKIFVGFAVCILSASSFLLHAQGIKDSLLNEVSLQQCIEYALKHQPLVQQALTDEAITETEIKSRLADWYPQVNGNFNLLHYFQLPTAFFPDANGVKHPTKTGVVNTSLIGVGATQNIFNRDLLLANRTAGDVRLQARQRTISNKIDVVVEVTKAFYDIIVTERQVQVLDENIIRLQRSYQDAYNQYQGGVVDKIDYKRALISLNNTKADRKRTAETINSKITYLQQLMGYEGNNKVAVVYDSLQMERDIVVDTVQTVNINNRIEFQLERSQRNLLLANLRYNRTSYLPNISAIGNYSPAFFNDQFGSLYGSVYPSSYIGLQLSIPIFLGGKRVQNIRNAELQIKRLDLDLASLNLQVNTQYSQAMASYKGNLAELNALRENLLLATDVYNTLQLQYNAGIKTYLDVITAETELRSAQINYLNELFMVLSSKLDLQKALGTIQY